MNLDDLPGSIGVIKALLIIKFTGCYGQSAFASIGSDFFREDRFH
ncbi:MAG TPA: hypothetical protein VFG19_12550 [Geobacteraceae bacterium]|nr:hypothetical protein [Geobacteraceae bacterium]